MEANVHDISVAFSWVSKGTRTMLPTVALRTFWVSLVVVISRDFVDLQAPEEENEGDCELLPSLHLQLPEGWDR